MESPHFEHLQLPAPQKKKFPWILSALALVVLVTTVMHSPFGPQIEQVAHDGLDRVTNNTPEAEPAVPYKDPFANLKLEAKAAYVYDTTTGKVIFEKNPDLQLPLASLTKIMMALVSSEVLSKNSIVPITAQAVKQEGDNGFRVGEKWKFGDLLNFTLIVSSNDGAHAIAQAAGTIFAKTATTAPALEIPTLVTENSTTPTPPSNPAFIARMNAVARSLGLNQTYYLNESGIDVDKTTSGAYGSAKDTAVLFEQAMKTIAPAFGTTAYDNETFRSLDLRIYPAKNTDTALNQFPRVIASKTGFTDLAGGNLAIAFDAGLNHPVIVVVLGSSREGRFSDTIALSNATIDALGQAPSAVVK